MPRTFISDATRARLRTLDVRPDDTDSRDYIFQPSLNLLPNLVDPRHSIGLPIRDQGAEGACVGFALAAVINTSLACRAAGRTATGRRRVGPGAPYRLRKDQLVSERMLYEMARRYDEWEGESYQGTSLRGAMKGWHKHGVTTAGTDAAFNRDSWPYVVDKPGTLTEKRAAEAQRRPLGAYYRIVDSDVSHMQAAIVEGDAVLASAWIHDGWRKDRLRPARRGDVLKVRRIAPEARPIGLHAFAMVGYAPEGFLIQNSWGRGWGSGGLALLSYEDWFQYRQDAWVARPGPETLDGDGKPQIFLIGFQGRETPGTVARAGTSGAEGLGISAEVLPYLINTGDRGELSTGGRLETPAADLPTMASLAALTPVRNGFRNVVLYAHGGLVSETDAARGAARLWDFARGQGLTAYFFIWETGVSETVLGMFKSQDDAAGPRAGFSIRDLLQDLKEKAKEKARQALREAQRVLGRAAAPVGRIGWSEMHARARGAATAKGGAALFARALFSVLRQSPGAPFRVHLVGHSAGSIYLARLYDQSLRAELAQGGVTPVRLRSIQFMAPAVSVNIARQAFVQGANLPVPAAGDFRVHVLEPRHEDTDSIVVYPSSLLTYVADCLEDSAGRVPLLGLKQDVQALPGPLGGIRIVEAAKSEHHGDFDEEGHEVETILSGLSAMP